MTSSIRIERLEDILRITFDSAPNRNAIGTEALNELDRLANEIAGDRSVRAVILTGAGDRAFTSGFDLRELTDFGVTVQVSDPLADSEESEREYGVTLTQMDKLDSADCIVLAVAHTEYVQAGWGLVGQLLIGGEGVVFDIRGVLPRESKPEAVSLWRL